MAGVADAPYSVHFSTVMWIRPGTVKVFGLAGPAALADRFHKVLRRSASRLSQPQFAAGSHDPFDQRQQRLDVRLFVERIGGEDQRESLARLREQF